MGESSPILNYHRPRTRTARPPSDVPALLLIAIFAIALLPIMLTALYPIAKQLPIGQDIHANIAFPHDPELRVALHSDGDFGAPARFTSATVWLPGSRSDFFLDIDLATLNCQLFDFDVPAPQQPFDRNAMLDLYKASATGKVATTEQAQADVDAVLAAARAFSPDRLPPDYTHDWRSQVPGAYYAVAGHTIGDYDEPNLWLPWYTVYVAPIWLVITGVLGRWFLRLYRRRVRRVSASPP